MSSLKLYGSTSGYVEIVPEATAGNNSVTLPNGSGSLVVGDSGGNLNVSGIITASQINVGTGVTIDSNGINIGVSTFYGDASGLTNVPAGSSATGNFTITNGNVVVSSGYGIDFSATSGTGTSELFDDYEEGTWTPTVGGTSTYGARVGSYVKIGRVVFLQVYFELYTVGTGSATLLGGIPFPAAGDSSGAGSMNYFSNIATSVVTCNPYVQSNNPNHVQFRTLTAASATMGNANIFQNNVVMTFALAYLT